MDPLQGTTVPPATLRIAKHESEAPFIGDSLDLVMDALPCGLIYVDGDMRVQLCNRQVAIWFGGSAEALRGREVATVFGAGAPSRFEAQLRRAFTGEHATCEHVLETPDHGGLTFETTSIPDRDAYGRVRGVFALLAEVIVRKRAGPVALHVSQHDQAGEVPGPQHLADQLREALEARRSDGQRMALLWLGLEGVQPSGPLLADIARRVASCVRRSDLVARIGAGEIAVLLPNVAETKDAARVAEKIHALCQQAVHMDGESLHPQTRIGVAVYPDHATDAAGMIAAAEADLALARYNGYAVAIA